jgi:uncharacterized protein
MEHFLSSLLEALKMSLGMFWQIAWSLALGFTITSWIEVTVSRERIISRFGKSGVKEVAMATVFGAISSSCSYAAASTSRSLFRKGASLVSSLAFLFSSTNLVVELGIILWMLMGWQFAIAEWIGGIVLISIMTFLVKWIYPRTMIEKARRHGEPLKQACCGHDQHGEHHHPAEEGEDKVFRAKMINPHIRRKIANNYFMEWSMLWNDLVIGLIIAGIIGVFVPQHIFDILFLKQSSPWIRELVSTFIGPILAIFTFVCSIGNVPLAAIFWSQGLGFSGVISFLYADLIVIPLLDVYRKYYGWKFMWYIFLVFFATMVLSGWIMSLSIHYFHLIPGRTMNVRESLTNFKFNYTFYLNVIFGILSLYLFLIKKEKSKQKSNQIKNAIH